MCTLRAHMPGIRLLLVSVTLLAAGCGEDDPTTTINCGDRAPRARSPPAAPVAVTAAAARTWSAPRSPRAPTTTVPGGEVSIACADDIVPGRLRRARAGGHVRRRGHVVRPPVRADAALQGGAAARRAPSRRHVRIVAKRAGQAAPFFPPVSNRAARRRRSLRLARHVPRRRAHDLPGRRRGRRRHARDRAVRVARDHRHLDGRQRRDVDRPAPPRQVRHHRRHRRRARPVDGLHARRWSATSCSAGSAPPRTRPPAAATSASCARSASTRQDQFEITADFEHMITQDGDGVGLTLRRSLYMQGVARPRARAVEPRALQPGQPVRAARRRSGVLRSMPAATRCANPIVLADFYDREFNPTGAEPGDHVLRRRRLRRRSATRVFDPSGTQTDPAEILLAVDLNDNGQRDAGEPVDHQRATSRSRTSAPTAWRARTSPATTRLTNPDPARRRLPLPAQPARHRGQRRLRTGRAVRGRRARRRRRHLPARPGSAGRRRAVATTSARATASGTCRRTSRAGTRATSLVAARRRSPTRSASTCRCGSTPASATSSTTRSSSNTGVGGLMASYQAAVRRLRRLPGARPAQTAESAYDFTEIDWTEMPRNALPPLRQPRRDRRGDRCAATAATSAPRSRSSTARPTAFAWLDKRWPDGDRSETLRRRHDHQGPDVHTSPTTGRAEPVRRCSCRPATTSRRTPASATRSSTSSTATARSRRTSSICRACSRST